METSLTKIYEDKGKVVIGYVLNIPLSSEDQQKISDFQQELQNKFGENVWPVPSESLHITLMDWLSPLVDYNQGKDKLFLEILLEYETVLESILKNTQSFKINFSSIEVREGAIFMKGQDQGQFESIRNQFIEKITLLPGTKQPPKIIHFTLARFTKEVPLEPIQEFVKNLNLSLEEEVGSLRLIRERATPMLEFEVIKNYPLES